MDLLRSGCFAFEGRARGAVSGSRSTSILLISSALPAREVREFALMTDPAGLRARYTRGALDEADLADSWLAQLRLWFDAAAADPTVIEPNAIQLATAGADGRPAVRTVLVKGI